MTLARSGIFDLEYYSAAAGEVFPDRRTAARHCVTVGMPAGLSPNPFLAVTFLPKRIQQAWVRSNVIKVLDHLVNEKSWDKPFGPLFHPRLLRRAGGPHRRAARRGAARPLHDRGRTGHPDAGGGPQRDAERPDVRRRPTRPDRPRAARRRPGPRPAGHRAVLPRARCLPVAARRARAPDAGTRGAPGDRGRPARGHRGGRLGDGAHPPGADPAPVGAAAGRGRRGPQAAAAVRRPRPGGAAPARRRLAQRRARRGPGRLRRLPDARPPLATRLPPGRGPVAPRLRPRGRPRGRLAARRDRAGDRDGRPRRPADPARRRVDRRRLAGVPDRGGPGDRGLRAGAGVRRGAGVRDPARGPARRWTPSRSWPATGWSPPCRASRSPPRGPTATGWR